MALQAKIKGKLFHVGDLVKVFVRLVEGEKTRTQPFEGLVMAIKGRGENKTFMVRKIASGGIGVERIWPVNSPWLEKIEVKKQGKVRRSKLYYLRKRKGKAALKVKIRQEKKKKRHLRGGRKDSSEVNQETKTKSEQKTTRQTKRKPSRKTSSK